MRYFASLVLVALLSVNLIAQDLESEKKNRDLSDIKTKLAGRIIDFESGKPVEAATVQIFSIKDTTKLVKGAATDKDGNFVITDFKPGKYEVRVSSIGYNTSKIKEVTVSPMEPEVSLGDIKIKAGDEFVTSEISVEAEQNFMEMGVDKKVFNVDKDINSQSGSVTDVLKNVPSVTIDSDGRISLRGSGNVKILINGKPSGLLSTDPIGVLETIPANTVDRIEVINNPSAKYDPEGISGIINIVLKKGQSESNKGYTYNLSLNAGTGDKYNLSTGLSFRTGKWNLYGNYSYRSFNMNVTGASKSNNFLSDSLFVLNTSTNMFNKMRSHLGTVGFDFDINKENYLGMSVSYSNRDRNRNELTNYKNYDKLLNPTFFYDMHVADDELEDGLDANLNYKLNFKNKFQDLTISSQFSSSNEKGNINSNKQDLNYNSIPVDNTPYIQNEYVDSKFRSFSLQGDYVHPLKIDESHGFKLVSKLELGFRSQLRNTDDNYRLDTLNYNTGIFNTDAYVSNDFSYNEQIHALYGTYENKYKKFGYQVGLRLEQTFTKSEQPVTAQNYDNNYFSFFPSLFVKQGLSDNFEIQASFTRRINRPSLWSLNPFIIRTDPQNLRTGNPDLKPEYVNGIEVGAVKYFNAFTLTSSVFYRLTTDVITRYSVFDSNGVATNKPENLSQARNYGVELIGTGSLAKWWFVNASASYFRSELDGNIQSAEIDNSGYSWTAKLISNMTFKDLFDVQLSYFYQGENVTSQGTFNPMQSLDLTMKKDFLQKRMSLGFRISDLLNTQGFGFSQSTSTFTRETNRRRDGRSLFLTFTYRIGTDDKKNKKKPQQQEENRDREGQEF
ncbi:MAG: TonB-dependent receptor [Candidatus Kapaibacterium sp.]